VAGQTKPASSDEHGFDTALCASARKYTANEAGRYMASTKIRQHPDRPHDNRLPTLFSAGTAHHLLIRYRNMKEAR
jgi:hypothetical protein